LDLDHGQLQASESASPFPVASIDSTTDTRVAACVVAPLSNRPVHAVPHRRPFLQEGPYSFFSIWGLDAHRAELEVLLQRRVDIQAGAFVVRLHPDAKRVRVARGNLLRQPPSFRSEVARRNDLLHQAKGKCFVRADGAT